jgi:hypothetical protein
MGLVYNVISILSLKTVFFIWLCYLFIEHTCRKLFQEHVVNTTLDIYVFIHITLHDLDGFRHFNKQAYLSFPK